MFILFLITILLDQTMSYPTGEAEAASGFDLHAKILRKIMTAQNQDIVCGGYLTNKFKSIVFQPAIDMITFDIKKISDQIRHQDTKDIAEIVCLTVTLIII